MFEEQQKREKAKERELKLLQDDLRNLKKELGRTMKSEVSSIIKDKDENLKVIDKKLDEMNTMVTESLTHKDDHKQWVLKHEEMQEIKLTDLKSHIDSTLVGYKKDLDQKLKTINRDKDKVKESLQEEITAKENELSIYKNKIDQLKTELNKAHENIEKLENKLKGTNSELKTIKNENKDFSSRKLVIEDELSVLKKHNEGLVSKNNEFKGEIKKLESEIRELDAQINSKGGEKDGTISSLRREIKEKDENIDLLSKELNKLKADKKELDEEVEELKEERNKLKDELDAKAYLSDKDKGKRIKDLEQRIDYLESKLERAKDEIKKLESGKRSNREIIEESKITKKGMNIKKEEPKGKLNKPAKKTALTMLLNKYCKIINGTLLLTILH